MIVYDCEIINGIPPISMPNITYCSGWSDFKNMGISCICAYDYEEDIYHTYCADNFPAFQRLVYQSDIVVGFNSRKFDDKLCAAHGIEVATDYDIYLQAGKSGSLSKLCEKNLGTKKSLSGKSAPILWQRGNYGKVIDYCLTDVTLTVKLLNFIMETGSIIDKTGKEVLINGPR